MDHPKWNKAAISLRFWGIVAPLVRKKYLSNSIINPHGYKNGLRYNSTFAAIQYNLCDTYFPRQVYYNDTSACNHKQTHFDFTHNSCKNIPSKDFEGIALAKGVYLFGVLATRRPVATKPLYWERKPRKPSLCTEMEWKYLILIMR